MYYSLYHVSILSELEEHLYNFLVLVIFIVIVFDVTGPLAA